jgi:NAD(P)-dependent dehydrogenase (short-subunit alcohol dehydrogenase family)
MDIAGKKAIVLGGTSGIGLATSLMLVEKGADVVAVSRDPSKAGDVPAGIRLAALDSRDSEAVEAFFNAEGDIDILVNSATGGSRAFGPFMEMDMKGFQGSFDKLWGYANVLRYGASHVRDHGSIVLVSGSPARKPKPGQIALSAVGSAVEALARAIAAEIAPKRVNVVSPGIIDTPMVALSGEDRARHYQNVTKTHLVDRTLPKWHKPLFLRSRMILSLAPQLTLMVAGSSHNRPPQTKQKLFQRRAPLQQRGHSSWIGKNGLNGRVLEQQFYIQC